MIKRLTLTGAAIAAFWLYRWSLFWALGHATAMPFPSWWLHVVPRGVHGIFLWALLWHTLAVVVVAIPFAWLLARYYGRYGVYLACAATLLIVGPDLPSTAGYFGQMSGFQRGVTLFDITKMLVALPLLVLLLRRSPSNNRWSGPWRSGTGAKASASASHADASRLSRQRAAAQL
jgi:hypothetical protein